MFVIDDGRALRCCRIREKILIAVDLLYVQTAWNSLAGLRIDPAAGGPAWERLLADFGMPEEWLPWEPKL